MSDQGRILITGAGGFVGSHLAEGFAAEGWSVTAVDREFDEPTRRRLAAADLVVADLRHDLPSHLPHARVVVHAAAVTTEAGELGWSRAAHVAANLQPLERLLDHAQRRPSEAFVFLSSSGVFDVADGHGCLADVDLPTARTPYAVAKQLGEAMTAAVLDGCCHAHVVRLGYVYGPHEAVRPSRTRVSAVAQWLAAARAGRPLEVRADNPRRDWTFAPDLAPALAGLLAQPSRRRAVHLASPHVLHDVEVARLVTGHFEGSTCTTVTAPSPLKLPMRASVVCCATTSWTDPATGIARVAVGQEPA